MASEEGIQPGGVAGAVVGISDASVRAGMLALKGEGSALGAEARALSSRLSSKGTVLGIVGGAITVVQADNPDEQLPKPWAAWPRPCRKPPHGL